MKEIHINRMIRSRSEFIKDIGSKYQKELDILEQIHVLGRSMANKIKFRGADEELFKAILTMACVRVRLRHRVSRSTDLVGKFSR